MYPAMRERAEVPYPVQVTLPTRRERPAINALNHELREAYASVAPAAVLIVKESPHQRGLSERQVSVGSGFIIDQTPQHVIIATNRHVVEDPEGMLVQTAQADKNHKQHIFQSGHVVYKSPRHDIAFIALDKNEHPDMHFSPVDLTSPSQQVQVPDFLMTVSSPQGFPDTVNVGHVSQAREERMPGLTGSDLYRQVDIRAIPGKSGSMVIDPSFDPPIVVGMITQNIAGEPSLGYMLPVEAIKQEYSLFQQQERSEVIPVEALFAQLHSLAIQSQMQFLKHIPARKY